MNDIEAALMKRSWMLFIIYSKISVEIELMNTQKMSIYGIRNVTISRLLNCTMTTALTYTHTQLLDRHGLCHTQHFSQLSQRNARSPTLAHFSLVASSLFRVYILTHTHTHVHTHAHTHTRTHTHAHTHTDAQFTPTPTCSILLGWHQTNKQT